MRPRIAIPVPTSFDLEYNAQSWPQYAAAVEQSGGEAVQVPLGLSVAEVAGLARTCQGVLLPGSGSDVSPETYGQEPVEACAPADSQREETDRVLLEEAHSLFKPILGVCFGHQSLNVWRGGSLVQDLTVLPVNHAAGKGVAVAHSALVAAESMIGGLLCRSAAGDEAPEQEGFLRLPINSSHHQAVGVPGEGLRVVARCPQDGVIEAVEGGSSGEGADHFVVGVQWHPERSFAISAASRALFARFVTEAIVWGRRSFDESL